MVLRSASADLAPSAEMVWKRPADGGGQDDRDPDESAHQDNESAEPFDQWADGGRAGVGSNGAWSSS